MKEALAILSQATGICCHSSEVKEGSVFVAVRGRAQDGNHFATEAAARGAVAIITDSPQTMPALPIPVLTVDNARQTLAALAAAFYKHPSRHIRLTGITGTNGKTTITCMLEQIFRQAGLRSGLIGTVRVTAGDVSFPSKLTTPDAVSLQSYLALMRDKGVTHAAMEVSAQGVELHRADHIQFSCGMITNVSPDHLDFHHSFSNYAAAKAKFLELLNTKTPLVINNDDSYCRQLARQFAGPVITAAIGQTADIRADIIEMNRRQSRFIVSVANRLNAFCSAPQPFEITVPTPGRHNVENALLTAAAALLEGIDSQHIIDGLFAFNGVERRLNVFRQAGVLVIDDTALNPASIDAVFNTLPAFRFRRLTVVNAIRGQRGPAINALNAAALAKWRQTIPFTAYITASADCTEAADRVTMPEKRAFLGTFDTEDINYIYLENLAESIACAFDELVPGDALLLLGAQGMDQGRAVLTALTESGLNNCGADQQHVFDLSATADML